MTLLNVPTELLEEVIVFLVHIVGLDESMKLRLICRKADRPTLTLLLIANRAVRCSCPAMHIPSTERRSSLQKNEPAYASQAYSVKDAQRAIQQAVFRDPPYSRLPHQAYFP